MAEHWSELDRIPKRKYNTDPTVEHSMAIALVEARMDIDQLLRHPRGESPKFFQLRRKIHLLSHLNPHYKSVADGIFPAGY